MNQLLISHLKMMMSFLVIMIHHLLSLLKGAALSSPSGLDLLLLVVEVLDSRKPHLHLYPQYLVLVNLGEVHVINKMKIKKIVCVVTVD